MHVGFYIPVIEENPGGLGVYIQEVCGRMVGRIERVTVFTGDPARVPEAWGVDAVVPMTIPAPVARLGRAAGRLLWLHTALPALARRLRLDALFSPLHEGSLWPGVPQVLVVHDLTMITHADGYANPLLSLYARRMLPAVMRRTAQVVAVSEHTRADITRLLGVDPAHVEVVYEGAAALFHPRPAEEVEALRARWGLGRYILYTGTSAAHKNLKLLPEVFAALRARGHEDVQLALCGRLDIGPFDAVQARIDALGLRDRVVVPGYVTRDELAGLMSGAEAFVFPSLYEGFGLAPLEAMACGAPIVCSRRASLVEVVGDAGPLLDPEQPEQWVDALDALLSDPARVAAGRAASLQRAARFDWDDAASQLVQLLARVTTT